MRQSRKQYAWTRRSADPCSPGGEVLTLAMTPLAGLPAGHRPWFEASLVARPPRTVWFGHWAALGYLRGPGWCAVDTGCVWGRTLTAVCIEDGQRVQVPRHPADAVAFA